MLTNKRISLTLPIGSIQIEILLSGNSGTLFGRTTFSGRSLSRRGECTIVDNISAAKSSQSTLYNRFLVSSLVVPTWSKMVSPDWSSNSLLSSPWICPTKSGN